MSNFWYHIFVKELLHDNHNTFCCCFYVFFFLFYCYSKLNENVAKTVSKQMPFEFTIYNHKCNTCLKVSALTLNKNFIAVFKMKKHGTTL